jgi:hypothetical protein
MAGSRKGILDLFSQEHFTYFLSRVSDCKFIAIELGARVWFCNNWLDSIYG